MPNKTIQKIRNANNDAKKQRSVTEPLARANSIFEASLKEQLVRFQKIDFDDVVLYAREPFSSSGCYLCNGNTLVLLNVIGQPDFVTHWEIKRNRLGDRVKQAIVFFLRDSQGVVELLLSANEINGRRLK